MTISYKMLRRIFSRIVGYHYVIMGAFFLFFVIYEMKQLYHKFQKERRFNFYQNYVSLYFLKKKFKLNFLRNRDFLNNVYFSNLKILFFTLYGLQGYGKMKIILLIELYFLL